MAGRVHQAYELASHAQTVSTGTGDVKTVSAADHAVAVFVSVTGEDMRVTFDGTTPSSTNGLIFKKDVSPIFVPLALNLSFKAVSVSASASTANWAWMV